MPRSRPGAAAPADEPTDEDVDEDGSERDVDDDGSPDDLDESPVVEGAAGPLPPPFGLAAIIAGFVAAQILGAVAYIPLVMSGWDLYAPGGNGAAVGQAAGHLAVGDPVEVLKSLADLPLWAYFLAQLPFWLGFLVPAVAIVGYRYGRQGIPALVRWVGLRFRLIDLPVGIAVGIACQIVMVQGLYWLVFKVAGEQDVSAEARQLTDRATDGWAVLTLVLVVGIAAPLVEELYFRGLSMQVIERRWGATVGVLGSSAFFAITHFQPLQLPALFIFGLVLAFLVHRADRLGPAIVAHLAFNLTAVVMLVGGIGA
ncbi:MAG: type II CAAX endopeptidase family protein [Acidimicrobiales bacterium]